MVYSSSVSSSSPSSGFVADPGDVVCRCGFRMCFSCKGPGHHPAPWFVSAFVFVCPLAGVPDCVLVTSSCVQHSDLMRKWLIKEQSDDANEIWLKARTKECPKCNVRIEKNKACNHMTCSNCNHQFCWLCKGSWDTHGTNTGGSCVPVSV
jgi:ariadne-1